MKLVMLNEISDETMLVRFVDECGMRCSIGKEISGKVEYTFPLQLLSYFRVCEGNASDAQEGNTIINLGENGTGSVGTCNDALISCWSVYKDVGNPWSALAGSSFAEKYPYAIVSSLANVKRQIKRIMNEINHKHKDDCGALLLNAIYGLVSYYPSSGLPIEEWKRKIASKFGVDVQAIFNIFYKPIYNLQGIRYDAEKECRFALILNMRSYRQNDGSLLHANEIAKKLVNYKLAMDSKLHYLDKIYWRDDKGSCHELSVLDTMAI